jgi:hypothetical protein
LAGCGAIVDERVAFLVGKELSDVRCANFHFKRSGDAIKGFDALAGKFLAVLVQVDKARGDDEAGGIDDAASAGGVAEMRAIFPSRMPTLRTASRPVSGSMTRPPSRMMSYCWADRKGVENRTR